MFNGRKLMGKRVRMTSFAGKEVIVSEGILTDIMPGSKGYLILDDKVFIQEEYIIKMELL